MDFVVNVYEVMMNGKHLVFYTDTWICDAWELLRDFNTSSYWLLLNNVISTGEMLSEIYELAVTAAVIMDI